MLETAGYLLQSDQKRTVFLDGRPFSRRYQIENAINAAASMRQSWRILECVCAEEVVKRRLKEQAEKHPAANRNYQLYLEVRSRFEAITFSKTVIDTEQPLEVSVERALLALR
jgi:predicted kinase